MRRVAVHIALVAAVLGGAALVVNETVEHSDAAKRSKCAPKRGKVVERSRSAVVIKRVTTRRAGARLRLYGCLLKRGRMRRIANLREVDATPAIGDVKLAGRFVAFGWESGEVDGITGIDSFDLRRGERTFRTTLFAGRRGGNLGAFVLKWNGSIAWERYTGYDNDPPHTASVLINDVGGQREMDDRLASRDSLALSQDQRHIYWISADGPRSAPIY